MTWRCTVAEYRVSWTIEVEADSPEEAAREALEIQRDRDSEALFFDVWHDGEKTEVYLEAGEADPVGDAD